MRINPETGVGIFVVAALGIFFYMTFQIGVFRLDTSSFRPQIVYFKDVSGLARKADVKIAGVKVGWVESINLVQGQDAYQAVAQIMVNKNYQLRSDAYAIVRQDGLLGVKYLEITPGDPLLPSLGSGQPLGTPGKAPVSIDELLQQFKKIATNVDDITETVKDSIGGTESKAQLRLMFENLGKAAEKIASFSDGVDRIVNTNENDVNAIIQDIRALAHELRQGVPGIQDDIRRVAQKLEVDVLPSFQASVEKISRAFDRDFDKMANTLESTADAIQQAAYETRDGFKSIGHVATKIDQGKGLLGKLVNEDQTYNDLKSAVQGLKNYFAKVESLGIVFDAHGENMYAPAEHFEHKDTKGYLDIRIHPSEDRFYILEVSGSTKGTVKRKEYLRAWYDQNDVPYDQNQMNLNNNFKLFFAPKMYETVLERDTLKYGLQFGKVFKDIAFRFGIFESTFGVGIDYDIPFGTDNLRWVTTFEAFDWRGRDRIHDERPHFKWLNRVFFLRNLYFAFGADDFISKHNANAYFGAGIRFGDDDIKYFISRLGIGGGGK